MKQFISIIILLFAIANNNFAEKRLALVIGNSDYPKGSYLENPVHDADSVAKKLKELNFDVIKITDCTLRDMNEGVKDFAKRATDYDVALFFYAGHGMQSEGENYLIPIDAELETQADVKYNCTSLNYLLDKLDECGCPMKIIVLDACRNNPLARSWSRSIDKGLAIVNPPKGTFITFSTAAGKTALDGDGHNSPYTTAFIESLEKPNLALFDFFNEVGRSVLAMTDNKQDPWANHSTMGGRFVFNEDFTIPENSIVDKTLVCSDSIVVDDNVAGELAYRLPYNALLNVVSLRISGYLNGTDIAYLRGAFNQRLRHLDLHDVNIVAGGEKYIYDFTTEDNVLGNLMFYQSKLHTIILPTHINSIGDSAFSECHNLSRIIIPHGVKTIGRFAFQFCSSLKSLTIPESVNTIGIRAFNGCKALSTIKIPINVKNIDVGLFEGCRSLVSIELPNGITSVGDYAFSECHRLKHINLPSSITNIGYRVFWKSDKLNVIYSWIENITNVDIRGFHDFDDIEKILPPDCTWHVPVGQINTYKSQAWWAATWNIIDDLDPAKEPQLGYQHRGLHSIFKRLLRH